MLLFGLYSCSALVWLLLGCFALKRDHEWLAVFIFMFSLYLMLLSHASLIIGAIKNAVEKNAKQKETEEQGQAGDSRENLKNAVEKNAKQKSGG